MNALALLASLVTLNNASVVVRTGVGTADSKKSTTYSAAWEGGIGRGPVWSVDAGVLCDSTASTSFNAGGAVGYRLGSRSAFNVTGWIGMSAFAAQDEFLPYPLVMSEKLTLGYGPLELGYQRSHSPAGGSGKESIFMGLVVPIAR